MTREKTCIRYQQLFALELCENLLARLPHINAFQGIPRIRINGHGIGT
jgi:hypothetical protein